MNLPTAGRKEPVAAADCTAYAEVVQTADMAFVAVPGAVGAGSSAAVLVDGAPAVDCNDDEDSAAVDYLCPAPVDNGVVAANNFAETNSVPGTGTAAAGMRSRWSWVERCVPSDILAAVGRAAAGTDLARMGWAVAGRAAATAGAHILRSEVGRSRHYHQGHAMPWCCAVCPRLSCVSKSAEGAKQQQRGRRQGGLACCCSWRCASGGDVVSARLKSKCRWVVANTLSTDASVCAPPSGLAGNGRATTPTMNRSRKEKKTLVSAC
jgi:hypothetical protein